MGALKSSSSGHTVIVLFGAWTLIGLVFSAVSYASAIDSRRVGVTDALRLNLVQFYVWGVLSPIIYRFSRRFPFEFRPLRFRSLLVHLPVVLLFSAIHQGIHLTVLWLIMPAFRQRFASITELYRASFVWGLYIDLIIASLIVMAAHAFIYYQDFRAGEVKQSELKAQLAQAKLQALKMQLHPHFLFNTLHSISSLVLEDPLRANRMIARLGEFLRLTLEHSGEQMVALRKEIEFLRCYLEIEQVRFEDRLSVDFKIEPATMNAHVPHLILQPLVENAIRHGIALHASPGFVKVEAKRVDGWLRLEVKDSGFGIKTDSNSTKRQGVGLSNVRARLKQIYGSEVRFEIVNIPEGGLTVILEMPFRADISDDSVILWRVI
jgi:two-component system, LytTR family, sensor kinase